MRWKMRRVEDVDVGKRRAGKPELGFKYFTRSLIIRRDLPTF